VKAYSANVISAAGGWLRLRGVLASAAWLTVAGVNGGGYNPARIRSMLK